MSHQKIAVLSGDGIGPEVVEQALKVLEKISKVYDLNIDYQESEVGGIAIDKCGHALPEKTLKLCSDSDAILFGSVGGAKWESLPIEEQPERAALLPLRKYFDLYANLRFINIYEELIDASPLKASILKGGLDILVIRELTGGIYFGQPKKKEMDYGLDTMIYKREEVVRIAKMAFEIARTRRKKVTSIDKANVLSTMVFWREVVTEVSQDYPEIELSHMYVDNASMQLVKNPQQFDILLCPNMFGDILSDEGAIITGSIGMLPSVSLAKSGFGLYEPIGGSAPDIVGKDLANPIAQILSLAMLLEYSLKQPQASNSIKLAISKTLQQGYRTKDIYSVGTQVIGTKEIGDKIVSLIE